MTQSDTMFPSLTAKESKYQTVIDRLIEKARSYDLEKDESNIYRANNYYSVAEEFSEADDTSVYYDYGMCYTYPIINRITIPFYIGKGKVRDLCEEVLNINDSNRRPITIEDISEETPDENPEETLAETPEK